MKGYINRNAFSIIEILIGIFIFSLGLVSIYAIITSTLKLNDYNRNHIIAMNLAREQLELMRNIRDTNYTLFQPYNKIDPIGDDYSKVFTPGSYYKLENNYQDTQNFPVLVEDITTGFGEGESELATKMQLYRLYIDEKNRYVFESTRNIKTPFYRYIYVDRVEDKNGVISNALKVTSKVIWNQKGYHEFEVKTILADWKNI